MTLRDEFVPYVDGNNLMAPNPVPSGTIKGSDNGPMFLSEYYVMLQKSGQILAQDLIDFQSRIGACLNSEGMLCRVPMTDSSDGQEQVDDLYGVSNGSFQLQNTVIPRTILWSIIKNLGFMDTVNPESHSNWKSFMLRQPQLIAALVSASFPSMKNPLHYLVRATFLPCYVVAAITLAISCLNAPTSDTDARRLSWHLWQVTKPTSFMCWLAGKIWRSRLHKDYPNDMNGVAEIYYHPQPNNPYSKYWITD